MPERMIFVPFMNDCLDASTIYRKHSLDKPHTQDQPKLALPSRPSSLSVIACATAFQPACSSAAISTTTGTMGAAVGAEGDRPEACESRRREEQSCRGVHGGPGREKSCAVEGVRIKPPPAAETRRLLGGHHNQPRRQARRPASKRLCASRRSISSAIIRRTVRKESGLLERWDRKIGYCDRGEPVWTVLTSRRGES